MTETLASTPMLRIRMLLAVTALAWCPMAPIHAQSAERGVDSAVAPGDDFFAWANGGWLAAARIPPGRDRWGARDEINELTRRQVLQLLDDASAAPAGSTARKAADFRAAWLNESAIEARGLASLRPALDSIARLQDKAALARLLGREIGVDVDPLNWGVYRSSRLLGLSVERGINAEKINVPFLVQGGLGLPDREHYLSAEPGMRALRERYQQYIGRLLALAGFTRAEQRATAVMALEMAIAQSHATREVSANDRNADHRWSRADFARQAPGLDWSAFFVAAGLAGQDTVVAWQPTAVTGVAALVAARPLQAWQDYLRFHLLDEAADVLPRAFAEAALAMRGAVATGQSQKARAQRALEATQLAMSDAIGRMYAERHFPAAQKARVQAIVSNVLAAFVHRVEAATWLSPATRTGSLAKLRALFIGIGYPDRWQDYSALVVDPADAAGNLRRAEAWQRRLTLARLGRPVDLTEWWIAPQTVGAILVFQQNAYDFSAALLQAPRYDATASEAANYGSIGAIIGHDVSHYVDMLGADWDTAFAERHWWKAEDMARFQAAAEPLVQQYAGYHPFPDLGVNGMRTRTENVADLAGLAAAFDAYRRTLGDRAGDREFVRQQDRQFFIAWARSWRSRFSDDALRTWLASDSHAPDNLRVATVRNMDAWYEAFDVRPGQRLYLEPGARVRIW